MKRIFIFSDYFTPAFRAGGPIKSLFLLTKEISKYSSVSVFTRDRDIDGIQFAKLDIDNIKLFKLNCCRINYLSDSFFVMLKVARDLLLTPPDAIYLNSFFSFRFSIFPLLLTKVIFRDLNIVIAPRGELSSGALSLKYFKKNLYIHFFRIFLYSKRVKFHFTSHNEASEFHSRVAFKRSKYFIAPNLVDSMANIEFSPYLVRSDALRIVYYSRISPKKNLLFFLNVLSNCNFLIKFDIYGFVDDSQYWEECLMVINSLPPNISVHYCGPVSRELGVPLLSGYDLFVLPTLNENFGHAIVEALSMGTPVLISDKTPWSCSEHGAINSFPLKESFWNDFLNRVSVLDHSAADAARREAVSLYAEISAKNEIDSYLSNFGISK